MSVLLLSIQKRRNNDMKKSIELYSIIKGTRDDQIGYWVTTRDIDSGMISTCFMHEKTSLKDLVQYLRDKGIVCPHRSYR